MSKIKAVVLFHLLIGLEICGRDNSESNSLRAFDNLVIDDPKYDANGNLLIDVTGHVQAERGTEGEEGRILLTIPENNIGYKVGGNGTDFDNIIRDVLKRDDCMPIIRDADTLAFYKNPAPEPDAPPSDGDQAPAPAAG